MHLNQWLHSVCFDTDPRAHMPRGYATRECVHYFPTGATNISEYTHEGIPLGASRQERA